MSVILLLSLSVGLYRDNLVLLKRFFIGFAASNFESIMGYTMKKLRKCDGLHAKGIKNL